MRIKLHHSPRKEVLAEGVELWLGDCKEVLPKINKVDAVITDTPYGINFNYNSYKDTLEQWKSLMIFIVEWIKSNATCAVLPSCQIAQMKWIYANIPPDWLVCWYKGATPLSSKVGFNDWEPHLVYGKPNCFPIHDFFKVMPWPDKNIKHPCPKPLDYSMWLVSKFAKSGQVVLDPFMGSATTGVAAVELGRKFIGIEIDPNYFDEAYNRVKKALDNPSLLVNRPVVKEPAPTLFPKTRGRAKL